MLLSEFVTNKEFYFLHVFLNKCHEMLLGGIRYAGLWKFTTHFWSSHNQVRQLTGNFEVQGSFSWNIWKNNIFLNKTLKEKSKIKKINTWSYDKIYCKKLQVFIFPYFLIFWRLFVFLTARKLLYSIPHQIYYAHKYNLFL